MMYFVTACDTSSMMVEITNEGVGSMKTIGRVETTTEILF